MPAEPSGNAALVMLMGLPGVGKSHCARLLADELGAAHVATDHIRSRLFIAASYTDDENAAVFGIAEALVDELLGEAYTVILDATHLVARYRAPAERVAKAHSVPVHHVLVTASDDETRSRLAARALDRAADDHSDADEAIYERMSSREFEPPPDGHLEIRNGATLADEIARVASVVRGAPR